jgi:penicillin-binding protein 1A
MVGGRDYAVSPFNRATQARRQPGSTFKLFVYLAALKAGWKPDDTIENGPITAGKYRPQNYGGRYSRSITLEDAFAQSSNVAAVRIFQDVGSKAVIKTARDLGVSAPLPKGDPTLALGTTTMTLIDLTAAYAGFAGNDYPVEPRAFPADKPGLLGSLLGGHGLPGQVHADMERMLHRVVTIGTGRTAALGHPAHGKTGTTQDHRDALFVGYAGDLIAGVWVGNDDNAPLKGVTGGGLPARIWRDFMQQALGAPSTRTPQPNPSGPIQPQDIPDLRYIPFGDASLRIKDGRAIISTTINGRTVDLEVDMGAGALNPDRIGEQIERERQRQLEGSSGFWEGHGGMDGDTRGRDYEEQEWQLQQKDEDVRRQHKDELRRRQDELHWRQEEELYRQQDQELRRRDEGLWGY